MEKIRKFFADIAKGISDVFKAIWDEIKTTREHRRQRKVLKLQYDQQLRMQLVQNQTTGSTSTNGNTTARNTAADEVSKPSWVANLVWGLIALIFVAALVFIIWFFVSGGIPKSDTTGDDSGEEKSMVTKNPMRSFIATPTGVVIEEDTRYHYTYYSLESVLFVSIDKVPVDSVYLVKDAVHNVVQWQLKVGENTYQKIDSLRSPSNAIFALNGHDVKMRLDSVPAF